MRRSRIDANLGSCRSPVGVGVREARFAARNRISVLMAENLPTGLVWKTFMRNAECTKAMQSVGFTKQS